MASIPVDDFGGPEGDSFKFEEVGDLAKGIVVHAEKIRRKSNFKPFPMQEVLRIVLDINGDNQVLWPVLNNDLDGGGYADRMAKAIGAAIRESGAKSLDSGGTLAVLYNEEIQTDANPARGFVAEYKPPVAKPVDTGKFKAVSDDGAVTGLI